ncbi:glycosyltransferase family 2 protein [Schaalia vaccimaxillae]|uniref:glycosyltransferase family 2 protein n=1 Tax=Schaalia vaccimaxillae TaxID=183916 RepID=UPI000590079F|nr:glycosyltransferase family 2 protein [Schaalia vaccimaxillae]
MTISVALCTYNGERFIAEQLRSILAQTVPVDEIIIGDDNSSDETLAICESLLTDSGVVFQIRRHRPGLGVRGNFSDAISATTGDVIFLCDQDDVWRNDKVESLLSQRGGAVLLHTDARLVDGEGQPLGTTLLEELRVSRWEFNNLAAGDALAVLLRRNLVTGATCMVDGNFARAAMPVPDGWIHDEWLGFLAALGHGLKLIPEPLIDYRQHEHNVIGAKKESLVQRFHRMLKPDPDDDLRRLTRASSAAAYVERTGCGSKTDRSKVVEAAAHQEQRFALPANRIARIPLIVREITRGRYSRYSRGWLTAGRDLLQVRNTPQA